MTAAHRTKVPRRAAKIIAITLGSLVALTAALLLVVLAAGGLFAPATYLQPWDKHYAATFEDPRMQLVAQAVLAPSSHNEQPWKVRLDTDQNVLYLYADSTRLTPQVDPLARQTMISQGTFLGYLKVAGEKIGTETSVELFPAGDYDESDLQATMNQRPVAKITLNPGSSVSGADHAALFLSDTNRSPYASTDVTDEQANELEDLPTDTGSTIVILRGRADVAAISDATIRGTVIESTNTAVAAESASVFRPNEYTKNASRSGFGVEGQGTSGFMKYLLQGLITLMPGMNGPEAAAARDIALATNGAEHTPAYVVLTTAGNTRVEQVEAGMLYARLSLRARSLGLVVQPVSQILEEYSSMQGERTAIHNAYASDGATIQMLVRMGTATTDYPPTMRRDANTLLITG